MLQFIHHMPTMAGSFLTASATTSTVLITNSTAPSHSPTVPSCTTLGVDVCMRVFLRAFPVPRWCDSAIASSVLACLPCHLYRGIARHASMLPRLARCDCSAPRMCQNSSLSARIRTGELPVTPACFPGWPECNCHRTLSICLCNPNAVVVNSRNVAR